MKKTKANTLWTQYLAWIAVVLLTGLLLSTCGSAGAKGPVPCVTGAELVAIENQAELKEIAENLSGNYCLKSSIALKGNWVPLDTFTGTLDGRGNTISGLTIDDSNVNAAFFTELGVGATVKDLTFDTPVLNGYSVAVLATESHAKIDNVHVINACILTPQAVKTDAQGANINNGGLVGKNYKVGIIRNSHATCSVTLPDESQYTNIGGIVGINYGTIENSYATGDLKGKRANVGGLVGTNTRADSTDEGGVIRNSYATGDVVGDFAGGLVGYNKDSNVTIENSYATGRIISGFITGGLVGENSNGNGIIENSYFDKTSTGQSDTEKGIGVSAAANIEFILGKYYDNKGTLVDTDDALIFDDWDPAIWTFATGAWPTLAWQTTP